MAKNKTEKQGCLSVFFPFLNREPEKTDRKPAREQESERDQEPLPYRVRDDFLSPAEFSFFKILSSLGGSRLIIQSKVRLADVFFVARPNENRAYFSRIAQKHLDFLICDSVTMKPLLGIELDDSSHKRESRQERDDFVDQVFEAASFPLLRFPVEREYSSREVAARIAPLLKDVISPPAVPPPPPPQTPVTKQENAIPLCPKCGIPMVLRTVSQGEHKGKQFYGCSNYPRCREMKPFRG